MVLAVLKMTLIQSCATSARVLPGTIDPGLLTATRNSSHPSFYAFRRNLLTRGVIDAPRLSWPVPVRSADATACLDKSTHK